MLMFQLFFLGLGSFFLVFAGIIIAWNRSEGFHILVGSFLFSAFLLFLPIMLERISRQNELKGLYTEQYKIIPIELNLEGSPIKFDVAPNTNGVNKLKNVLK